MENITKTKVISKQPCKISVAFEIDNSVLEKCTVEILSEIRKEARIPGFRVGKAPIEIVKKEFLKTARQKAINRLSSKTICDYLEKEKIKTTSAPVITDISYNENKNFIFRVDIEHHPEIKVKGYKKIKLVKKEKKITESDIEERLKILQERNATLMSDLSSDVVSKESFVVIDYDLFLNGELIPNTSVQNFLVDISNPANIKGLNEALIGAKIGDKKSVEVTFPLEHPNKILCGKKGNIEITVKEIKKKILPIINDDFAKDLGFESLAKLREAIKNSLITEAQQKVKDEFKKQIEEYLLKNNIFDVPETLTRDYQKSLVESTKNYYLSHGITDDEWNKNKHLVEEKASQEAKDAIRLFYIYDSIAVAENITVTQEEIDKAKEEVKKLYTNPNEFEKKWNKDLPEIRYSILKEKILKFIINNANITEAR